ncbi:phospholipid scramblase 2-like isoform X2 [Gigantopelta aegis]|uniref:phospholipid scramblase 2-like isoform X2 n=1 Tax=Gigantopelta aegis TaxID=1735272 RepID=UPI001B88CFE0|nr:phospholipid scramblase 2-like isoform X2 [Gigantopelta aegis]
MSQPIASQPQGQGPPGYGSNPQAGYGAPPGQYGAPPGQYGAPPGQYGAPPGQYGAPPQGYQYQNQQYTQGQPQMQPMPGQSGQPVKWMNQPEAISGCPPGLEYLTQVDQLLVKQQVELLEMVTGWETANKYKVVNNLGQQVYFAAEESDMCTRQCCGPQRGFIMHITDNMGQEVIRVQREFKCCAGCPWCAGIDCCAHFLTVESPVGHPIGYVRQMGSCWEPRYALLDADMNMILQIKGPCCICQGPCCTWDQEFNVFSKDESTEVGKISKQWTGLIKEMFTDADNFGVTFPMDLDVKMKAVLLAAVFLIDFMFFEQKQNNNN